MTTSRRSFLKRFGAVAGGTALIPVAKAGTMKGTSTKPVPLSRDSSWAEVQNQFMLDPEIIYMNIGTEGSLPQPVYDAYIASLKQFTASPTDAAFLNEDLNYYQETNREKVAKFMGAEKDEIVITGNTTMGVNVVLFGLDYKSGDEIIST
ncbi:MAG: aminotransferase class V-fold PLP-dependent enzyme, partial [Candidatus Marinimicrobia bacterium]|nr:aminotransferase class V-fold PLP-dependent enzyme [Candidatus Neomarinimicrobiota bacterium]